MVSFTAKMKKTPHQKFEGHTKRVTGAIHLPGGQQIITCSYDGSLRVWNLKSGKQIGEDWRDGGGHVYCIALSPDGKKVVSGSEDGAVRLWDIDTGKAIAKWIGHTERVLSVCWSRDGRGVLIGSLDGTARQWDMESRETILESIETGHTSVWAAVYSPDMTMIATGGRGRPWVDEIECSIKIWNTKTGKLVATLKGHTQEVSCLAWTKDGKTLISGSNDHLIRTWNIKKWKKTAVLKAHTLFVFAIAISPNDRILASASHDNTVLLWNLDNGRPIGPPLQHADMVDSVSFSEDGKLLATGCADRNAYTWDVVAIVTEAGLDDLLLNSKPSARRRSHSSASPGSTLLSRLFHRNRSPSGGRDTPLSSPLDWARNILKWRRQRGEGIGSQGPSPAVVEVPCAPGQHRNAYAGEKRKKSFPPKVPTASTSQPPKPNVTQSSSQPQAAISGSSTTPPVGDATGIATTSTTSRPDAMIRRAGLWTRF